MRRKDPQKQTTVTECVSLAFATNRTLDVFPLPIVARYHPPHFPMNRAQITYLSKTRAKEITLKGWASLLHLPTAKEYDDLWTGAGLSYLKNSHTQKHIEAYKQLKRFNVEDRLGEFEAVITDVCQASMLTVFSAMICMD